MVGRNAGKGLLSLPHLGCATLCETTDLLTKMPKLPKMFSILKDWEIANIMSMFFKGPGQNSGNYRPNSVTSVAGKLVKMSHLSNNEEQFWFLS